jgi:hypothetical protein
LCSASQQRQHIVADPVAPSGTNQEVREDAILRWDELIRIDLRVDADEPASDQDRGSLVALVEALRARVSSKARSAAASIGSET